MPEITGGKDRFGPTVEALVTRLIDVTSQADFVSLVFPILLTVQDSFSHIKAISLLCIGDATLIDTHKASVLLSYLRPAVNVSFRRSLTDRI